VRAPFSTVLSGEATHADLIADISHQIAFEGRRTPPCPADEPTGTALT
jgi:hypothetical protein